MYVGRDFDPANPTESEVYSLDFANDLQTGESISSVAVTLSVFQGTDATPSQHLSGNPVISGSVVSQRLGGVGAPGGNLLSGVTYTLSFTATTTLTNAITLYSRVACTAIN